MTVVGLSVVAAGLLVVPPLSGQDRITVINPDTGVLSQFTGQVIAWDRERVTYVSGGREREIPARRVIGIDYPKSAGHQEADRFYQAGRFDQAALALENAMASESRPWVAEEMRARSLQCGMAAGDLNRALVEFLAIYRDNPQTRFFHLVPLAWEARERAPRGLAGELEKLLNDDDPVRSLLAASWLLMTNDPAPAIARLKQLAIAADARVAQLADAQLWRPRLIDADEAELRRWHLAIERMPEALQAGPRFLAAMVQQRLQGDTEAVIAFMQIPVLFPEHYQLAGSALGQAHQLLEKLGRTAEAELVARELFQSYGFSAAAGGMQNPVDPLNQ